MELAHRATLRIKAMRVPTMIFSTEASMKLMARVHTKVGSALFLTCSSTQLVVRLEADALHSISTRSWRATTAGPALTLMLTQNYVRRAHLDTTAEVVETVSHAQPAIRMLIGMVPAPEVPRPT